MWGSTQRHMGVNTSIAFRKVEVLSMEEEAGQGTRLEIYMEIGLDLTFSKVRLRNLDWHLR